MQRLDGESNLPMHAIDLNHRAFPKLAAALRATTEQILEQLHELTLKEMPHLDHYTIEQFEDDLREILESVAIALDSADPEQIRSLLESAPRHGFDRFLSHGDLLDLFKEQRILRGVMVGAVEEKLGRKMKTDEAASLHATVDVMIQQGVLAMVQSQEDKLREAAEAELKFLSFFSHDLSNNMLVISSSLDLLKNQLRDSEQFEAACNILDGARRTIQHTTTGMRRLLEHERLRRTSESPNLAEVNLCDKCNKIADFFKEDAKSKNMRILVEADPQATVETDPDLLYIILQNIVGNALKHCQCPDVRLEAAYVPAHDASPAAARWRISVIDTGPGIERHLLDRIFESFSRGQALGAPGVGLGLAIAGQAAKLIGAQIDVDTAPGKGSTFHILLPAKAKVREAAATR